MTLPRAILTVLLMTLGGAAIGGGIGSALGYLVPGYYRAVVVNGADPSFDPVAVGFGLGLTQGATLGFIGALILVVAFLWFQSRQERARGAFPVLPLGQQQQPPPGWGG